MAIPLKKNTMAIALAMLMLLASLAISGSAQLASSGPAPQIPAPQIPACLAKLAPCIEYLNSTSPPKSCCKPLKNVLTNELLCICSIFKNLDILKGLNIDPNSALELPMHCGIQWFSVNSSCTISTGGAPGPSHPHHVHPPAEAPSPALPPAVSGGNNNNPASSTAWFISSSLMSLFVWWRSVMA